MIDSYYLSYYIIMFFFFESDTEKRVREDVEKNMEICLENPKRYNDAK